ncbi:cation diffusion facilitator family transporter [Sulfurimonas sp.]|uniref:cation diffusion facilitator family transporter n=1 Tax=Sulfurimonas sp. TaxID=2022749 RepID=UPI003568CAE2
MSNHHDHHSHHHHHHHHDVSGKNLFITVILNVIITVAQIIGGLLSGSLALLSDAVHNLSDVVSLLIAYWANQLSKRPGNLRKTFGYHRAEIIAALFNSSVLIAISVYLIFEAINKLYNPEPINSFWVIILGLLGIVVNALSVFIIKDDAHSNMNMKAAYLHLLADAMTSFAVVVGGVLMYYFNLLWVDSVITIIIALYLIWASYALVKGSLSVLMQFVPEELEVDEIVKTITQLEDIDNVHHVHVWQLDDNRIHLEAHLNFCKNISIQESTNVINVLEKQLGELYGISHVTFQCEYNRCENTDIIKNQFAH